MSELAQQYAVARLWPQSWVVGTLKRWLLPRYHSVLDSMRGISSSIEIRDLWRAVFGEPAPENLMGLDLDVEFAAKICRERFPLAMWVYDDYLSSGADSEGSILLQDGVVLETEGVAWEMEEIKNCLAGLRPVVACLQPGFIAGFREVDNAEYQCVAEWWGQRGYAEPPTPLWTRGIEDGEMDADVIGRVIEALDQLPQPLDGLGTALRVCVRANDNAFLDMVSPIWQGEYDQWDWWFWSGEQVAELTRQYDLARPKIATLSEYYDWYEREKPTSEERVIEILLGLDAQLGLVEDDDGGE